MSSCRLQSAALLVTEILDDFQKRRLAKQLVRRPYRFDRRDRAKVSRDWLRRRFGSQGAAGPCKRLNAQGEVVEVIEAREDQ
jgi:hypothetical protein